jgi:anaerobic magnesium-protoporphyrin IX monomethyl ester cyclase
VFGSLYRGRSPKNIVDEIENMISYGYDRVWLADDIFPINKKVAFGVCNEIIRRGLDLEWECLCRADLIDREMAMKMKFSGCFRVFFGLESGNDKVLKITRKRITVDQARRAVEAVKSASIKVGAFFILGYPGEDSNTMLDTIKFASSLPLNYLSFTVPYPIPRTGLYEKVKERILTDDWRKPKRSIMDHVLLYRSDFSMAKLKFGIAKALLQHHSRRYLGPLYPIIKPFENFTDYFFKVMK